MRNVNLIKDGQVNNKTFAFVYKPTKALKIMMFLNES